jgi:hypothetical protein
MRMGVDKSWLFLFSYLQHNKKNFFGWVKEVRTTKSYVCGARGGICTVNTFFNLVACFFYKAKDLSVPPRILSVVIRITAPNSNNMILKSEAIPVSGRGGT